MSRPKRLALLLLGALSHGAVATADTPPPYLGAWGTTGSGPGQFSQPWDVSADAAGRVFVLDTNNQRVESFGGDGAFEGEWPLQNLPVGAGIFALVVGPSGDVYVLIHYKNEYGEARGAIQRYSAAGTPLGSAELGGPEASTFSGLDLTATSSGDVWLAYSYDLPLVDRYDSYVARFPLDLSTRTEWGGPSATAPGQLSRDIRGIAVDEAGERVLLADALGSRIEVFSTTGTFLFQWGTYGSGSGQFKNPWSIRIGRSGHVIVTDFSNSRLEEFTGDGTFVSQWGSAGSGPAQFYYPIGLAVDAAGNIYVADTGNDRIQKFGSGPTPARKASWGALKVRYR